MNTLLKRTFLIISAVASLMISSLTFAGHAVIVNPANANAVDDAAIQGMFTGKVKAFADGTSAVPVDQKKGSPAKAAFAENVLGKSESQLKSYWSKLIFTGKGRPPKELSSDDEVKKHVASTPGAIGYIDEGSVDESVKVVKTF